MYNILYDNNTNVLLCMMQVYENGSLGDKTVIYFNLQQALRGIAKGPDRETLLMQRVRVLSNSSLNFVKCLLVVLYEFDEYWKFDIF